MKYLLLFLILFHMVSCVKREIYRFEVEAGDGFLNETPVSVNISDISFDNPILRQNGIQVPFQVDVSTNKLWFVHHAGSSLEYSIESLDRVEEVPSRLSIEKKDGNLKLSNEDNAVLQYRYEMKYPPHGVDSIFKKSGYIHPVLTPKGDTLTRIQPPDHYHHYGLWAPWTHTRIDTTRVDFWNLREGMGTVLFKEFESTSSGPLFSSFNAVQEHIAFKVQEEPLVALNENLEVHLWNLGRPDRYMFDYSSTFNSPLTKGIIFEAYRYGGGIGFRFHERWHKDNCEVLTSEGKNRLEADGTKARWCIVSGESADGKGSNGILFMSHPENRAHPEPMRVWPMDGNGGRGDMFFEFCPIRHEEWKIEPNNDYQLNYRMVVFDGELNAEEAEAYWQAFANPSIIKTSTN